MDQESVPVTIDDVKRLPDFKFSRCSYFTAECDLPSSNWRLFLEDRQIPVLQSGGAGIIFRPSSDELLFTDADQIERFFDAIEADPRLSVGTGDIWLPNELVEPVLNKLKLEPRGVTLRIGYELFVSALEYRTGRIEREQFETAASAASDTVTFSKEEHDAFKAWRAMQVDLARRQYPKSSLLVLPYEDKEVPTDE
jgi:hypothetical protein